MNEGAGALRDVPDGQSCGSRLLPADFLSGPPGVGLAVPPNKKHFRPVAKAKSRAELAAENRLLRKYNAGIAIAQVVATAVRVGGAVAIAFFGYKTVAVLAGQTTFAHIGVQFLTEVKVSEAVAWIFGTGGVFYGMRQGKLRKDTVERLAPRIQELERAIDPQRTSSRLTPRGDDPPEAV